MARSSLRTYCSSTPRLGSVARVARLPSKPRNFRASDPLWDGALEAADAAGENLPDKLREFLAWYQRLPGARMPTRPPARPAPVDD